MLKAPVMKLRTTIREALIIVLVTAILCAVYCAVSPVGRILLKKGLRMGTSPVQLVARDIG